MRVAASSKEKILKMLPFIHWVLFITKVRFCTISWIILFFKMFFNIARGSWSIVIQAMIGMFPQLLELINGITMQLIVLNRFLKMTNDNKYNQS